MLNFNTNNNNDKHEHYIIQSIHAHLPRRR